MENNWREVWAINSDHLKAILNEENMRHEVLAVWLTPFGSAKVFISIGRQAPKGPGSP